MISKNIEFGCREILFTLYLLNKGVFSKISIEITSWIFDVYLFNALYKIYKDSTMYHCFSSLSIFLWFCWSFICHLSDFFITHPIKFAMDFLVVLFFFYSSSSNQFSLDVLGWNYGWLSKRNGIYTIKTYRQCVFNFLKETLPKFLKMCTHFNLVAFSFLTATRGDRWFGRVGRYSWPARCQT